MREHAGRRRDLRYKMTGTAYYICFVAHAARSARRQRRFLCDKPRERVGSQPITTLTPSLSPFLFDFCNRSDTSGAGHSCNLLSGKGLLPGLFLTSFFAAAKRRITVVLDLWKWRTLGSTSSCPLVEASGFSEGGHQAWTCSNARGQSNPLAAG